MYFIISTSFVQWKDNNDKQVFNCNKKTEEKMPIKITYSKKKIVLKIRFLCVQRFVSCLNLFFIKRKKKLKNLISLCSFARSLHLEFSLIKRDYFIWKFKVKKILGFLWFLVYLFMLVLIQWFFSRNWQVSIL